MYEDMPIQHNGELFPPSDTSIVDALKASAVPVPLTAERVADLRERGQFGPPPPIVTSLDIEDLAWLRVKRDVHVGELESWRLSMEDRKIARTLREKYGEY